MKKCSFTPGYCKKMSSALNLTLVALVRFYIIILMFAAVTYNQGKAGVLQLCCTKIVSNIIIVWEKACVRKYHFVMHADSFE